MPKLACWSCGRQIYTVAPLESLFAEERRCPRCGAYLRDDRREFERRGPDAPPEPARRPGPTRGDGRAPAGRAPDRPPAGERRRRRRNRRGDCDATPVGGPTASGTGDRPAAAAILGDARRVPRLRADRRFDRARRPGRTRRAGLDDARLVAVGRRPAARRSRTASSTRPRRRPRTSWPTPTWSILAGPATACLAAARRSRRPVAGGPAAARRHHRRREHEGRPARRGPTRRACGSSAAIRWPGWRRAGTRPRRADLFVDRPWVIVPGAARRTGRRRAGRWPSRGPAALGRAGWTRRPTTAAVAGDQPPAAASSPRPWSRPSPARRAGAARDDWAAGARPRRERLARHDPPRPRRSRRWARRSRPPTRPRWPRGCATSGRSSTAGWRSSSDPDGPDEAAIARRASGGPRSARGSGVSDERVFVVPARGGPGRGRLVRAADRRPRRVRRRRRARRPVRAPGRDGAGPVVQAGHPVPRPARRPALLPDAADDRRRRTSRLHGRYSIGVGGHLNPGDGGLLGGLRREWQEELVADFVPDVPARGAAQRRHDAGRCGPPRRRLRGRRGRPAGRRSARRTS